MYPVAVDMPLSSSVDASPLYAPTIKGSTLSNGASIVARHSRADVRHPHQHLHALTFPLHSYLTVASSNCLFIPALCLLLECVPEVRLVLWQSR
jgi:hypothetical protein